ncbi:nonsense-mediated mRNA decay factor SMG5-like [Amphiura filiformis]|uniref:nonsense-mediated mRNA decay factor SMG5-like n=1 Tax=Amphiura filiformis TaxID=82378 RepID=UPI003B20E533
MELKESKPTVKSDIEKLQQTKRIYRSAQDIISKLDNVVRHKQPYRVVFERETVELRMKLKDLCERLMFLQPNDFGRKAEELLWWKVYYDVISIIKKNKKHMRSGSALESAYRTHLLAATGFYHHLLLRLQREYKISLNGVVDFVDISTPNGRRLSSNEAKLARAKEWAEKACHRCLIYLGDLARYRQDFEGYRSHLLAERFYHQALVLNPSMGMPHNQLGTLAGNHHQGLDAAYHYMRCWLAEVPFDGAIANLEKTLERNQKRFQELPRQINRDLPPELQRPRDIKQFLFFFLRLQELLQPRNRIQLDKLPALCQDVLQDFSLCMYYGPCSPSNHHPPPPPGKTLSDSRDQHVSDSMVFKVFMMSLMSVYKLQRGNSKQVSTAIAFTLAMFSHLLTHVNMRLQNAVYEVLHPSKTMAGLKEDSSESPSHTDESGNERLSADTITPTHSQQDMGSSEAFSDGNVKSKRPKDQRRKAIHKLRRRRRRRQDDQDESEESDLSEGALSLSSSGKSSSENDSSENAFAMESDSDYMMDSQDFEDETLGKAKTKKQEAESSSKDDTPPVPEHVGDARSAEEPVVKAKNSRIDSPVSMAQNLKDVSSQLFSHSPTPNFMKRNIKLAPSFEAYADDKESKLAEDDKEKEVETGPGQSIKGEDTAGELMSEHKEDEDIKLEALLQVLTNEGLLQVVKLVTDWLRGNSDVITTTAQSSQMLWSRMAVLLNFLPQETHIVKEEVCSNNRVEDIITSAIQKDPDWKQTLLLSEDIAVWKMPSLRDAHEKMTFDPNQEMDVSQQDETLLRIVCLRQFGHFLTQVKGLSFQYDADRHLYLSVSSIKDDNVGQGGDDRSQQVEEQLKMAEEETRRNQLMRDMAQLRLQSEVWQLEGSIEPTGEVSFSPYLVPDTGVLTSHLSLIRQLASSTRFIIIIPQTVIAGLDFSKKQLSKAREAIKYLEREFQKGNRYLRAQKENEILALENRTKPPRGEDKAIRTFYSLLECCRYFSQQSSDCEASGMATILTDYKPGQLLSEPLDMAIQVARSIGVQVEYAPEFVNRWKENN